MLSSFKKWVKNDENSKVVGNQSPGIQTMDSNLQRKFAKGVHYNMKIIIRGDRNTGKTCLWHRLQGHKFVEEYVPTPEIQAASIHWNYKATDDIVKVDVWDVVDQAKIKKSENLKTSNEKDEDVPAQMLDANFLDVYKGAHAVIIVFDMTKKWTFNYVENEIPKVPPHIPVLVLANHRDMGEHRVVNVDELEGLVNGTDRPPGSASVMFVETSMRNSFGLSYVHKFFNLPFLLLQRESLLKQLETNYLDVESCLDELRFKPESNEQNFNQFVNVLANKNSKKLTNPSPSLEVLPNSNGKSQEISPKETSQTPQSDSMPHAVDHTENSPKPSEKVEDKSTKQDQNEVESKRGFMSRFFKGSTSVQTPSKSKQQIQNTDFSLNQQQVCDIDDFIPEAGTSDQFLDQIPEKKQLNTSAEQDDFTSSDDEDEDNPMVAGFQEELDSGDEFNKDPRPDKVYTYSDSDDSYIALAKSTKQNVKPMKNLTSINLSMGSDSSKEASQHSPNSIKSDFSDNPPEIVDNKPSIATITIMEETHERPYPSSSEDELVNKMVSSFVEDVSDIEGGVLVDDQTSDTHDHGDGIKHNEKKNQQSFQLDASDFDFLESITNKSASKETTEKMDKCDTDMFHHDKTQEKRKTKHKRKKKITKKKEKGAT